jgi:hypothetical protein
VSAKRPPGAGPYMQYEQMSANHPPGAGCCSAKLSQATDRMGAMGKNNRQRRAEKRRARVPWQGPDLSKAGHVRPDRPEAGPRGAPQDPSTVGPRAREVVEDMILDASVAAESGNDVQLDATLRGLARIAARDDLHHSMVDIAMTGSVVRALRAAWEGGWQPADVVRAADKRLGRDHAKVAGQAIAAEARTSAGAGITVPESWAAQLLQIGGATGGDPRWDDPDRLRQGAAILGMLSNWEGWVAGRLAADQAHLGPEQQLSPGIAV